MFLEVLNHRQFRLLLLLLLVTGGRIVQPRAVGPVGPVEMVWASSVMIFLSDGIIIGSGLWPVSSWTRVPLIVSWRGHRLWVIVVLEAARLFGVTGVSTVVVRLSGSFTISECWRSCGWIRISVGVVVSPVGMGLVSTIVKILIREGSSRDMTGVKKS